jgi:hypothetical protein
MQNHPSYRPSSNRLLVSNDGLIVERDGVIHAHCPTLGAARALVRNTQRIAGETDHWRILDGETVVEEFPRRT